MRGNLPNSTAEIIQSTVTSEVWIWCILEVLYPTPQSPMAARWDLTDEQWTLVEPVLRETQRANDRGRPLTSARAVLNKVFQVRGTNTQARELPEKYLLFKTCHRKFQQWIRSGPSSDEAL